MIENHEKSVEKQVKRLVEIAIGLSAELNLNALLEKIVLYARELTNADAGTLYLLKEEKLQFKILQNESLGIFEGGTTGKEVTLAPVALNRSNVSAYAALEEKTVKIEDVYRCNEFDFSGPRRYDHITGYCSKSMLVVPMKNHEEDVIGVLQLMNAIDPQSGEVVEFPDRTVGLTEALASLAAVAITNAGLIQETKEIFESLIKVLAVALDAESEYTSNHIQRVAILNLFIAQAINEKTDGPFADVHFDENQLEEIRIAGWLHDVGKVSTPIHIMDKAHKLQSIFDRIELVKARYQSLIQSARLEAAEAKVKLLSDGGADSNVLSEIDREMEENVAHLEEELDFLTRCNEPSEFMTDDKLNRLEEIYRKSSQERITEDEYNCLAVRKGSLTQQELQIMKDHVVHTRAMLAQIPFTRHLKDVPLYASQHHERLSGNGYPDGLKGDQIPLQARILAVADFFEALVAKDRPYKKPMSAETALSILSRAAEEGDIDRDVLDLLLVDKVHEEFEKAYEEGKDNPFRFQQGA